MFNYNIIVGAENGLLKGINTLTNTFKNLNLDKKPVKTDEIVQICWSNSDIQDAVYFATKDHKIGNYKFTKENEDDIITEYGNFSSGKGVIRGLESFENNILTCVEDGTANMWSLNDTSNPLKTFNVGSNVFCVKKSKLNESLIASGGKENDLKIWDINKPELPIFKAKNISDNWVQLREPVWVMCMDFFDENKIAVGTGHHQLRIYDTKTGVRKPSINLVYNQYPITAVRVCPTNHHQIIVGNTRGEMEMIDMRVLKPCRKYKNIHGTVKSIEINDNYVATCGLDRFLRVYSLNSSDVVNKLYLKSRLNCLLYSKYEPIVKKKQKKNENDEDEPIEDDVLSDINSEDFGTEQLWSDIETVTEEHPEVFKRKDKINENDTFKKPK